MSKRNSRNVISLEGQITWKYCEDIKARKWVAVCDPFQITIQADSFPELREGMSESIDAMLTELLSTGDLDKFLEEHGWSSVSPIPQKSARARLSFDVPLNTRRISPRDLEKAFC
ncbi:MAG: hypothetical protein M3Y82_12390 [Verrucomicrobiota bacterium]|nr:hypothetical protein [Verrucomicrobiota bacterium]